MLMDCYTTDNMVDCNMPHLSKCISCILCRDQDAVCKDARYFGEAELNIFFGEASVLLINFIAIHSVATWLIL